MSALRVSAVALAAAIAAGAGGCGSSSQLSRADFVKQANAICKRVNDQLAAAGQAKSAADVQRIGPTVIAAEQRGLSDLRALKPPSSLAADYRRLVADLSQLTASAGKLLSAAKANDTAAAQTAASAAQQTQSEITALAGRDGLAECAKG